MSTEPPPVRRTTFRLRANGSWDGAGILAFVGRRTIDGVEGVAEDGTYARALLVDGEPVLVSIAIEGDGPTEPGLVTVEVVDPGDLDERLLRQRVGAAVGHLLDLETDGTEVDRVLANDPILRHSVERRPGHRRPASIDVEEVLTRAIFGQQVSVARARELLGNLAARHGEPLPAALATDPIAVRAGLRRTFPSPAAIASVDPATLPMPRTRSTALVTASALVADGTIPLHIGAGADEVRARLLEVRGIGPWTADYVALRGLGLPDVFLPTDLGVIRAFRSLGVEGTPGELARRAEPWSPWRSYALHRLWELG